MKSLKEYIRMRYIFLPILCLFSLTTVGQIRNAKYQEKLDSTYRRSIPLLSIKEFKKFNKTNFYILDARESEEFEVSHLKNARHVGYYWFDMRSVYDIPYDATIVVYCTIGSRSERIGEKLMRAGYECVYNMYGGILEWVNTGHPVYKTNGVQTSEIHTYNHEYSRWAERGSKVY
jgi:rhodanese-related sulfurtransferase